ncbi:sensor histidine kinase [Streptomyces sp. 4N509B]|uniref:sensor histidine kinase n=1 Tax=Streptomyces sp. 4N509B TaxID=3457413 RepID=UPI003FCF25DE
MAAPSVSSKPHLVTRDRVLTGTGLVMAADSVLILLVEDERGWVAALAAWLISLAAWLSLALVRRRPVPVALLCLASATFYYPVSAADGLTPIVAFIVALYFVARTGRFAAALTISVGSVALLMYTELVYFEEDRHVEPVAVLLLSGWFLGVIAFGHAILVRHAYQREAEQRALAAERERDVRARQSATEERLRIARELHDVLGHNISLINVQAAAAIHRSARRPGETAELVAALQAIRGSSRDALRELRATLGVLRQVDEETPTAPAAGLDRVEELAERARGTGLDVTVETTGAPSEPEALPPQISLAAYRIVQESLTNVTRHADARRAVVRVAYEPGQLRLCIDDDGRGRTPAPGSSSLGAEAGSGIDGMAERARALGGELTAVDTGGGFRVTARLPLPSPLPAREADAA